MKRLFALISLLFLPLAAFASEGAQRLDLTGNWVGVTSVLLFFVAYRHPHAIEPQSVLISTTGG